MIFFKALRVRIGALLVALEGFSGGSETLKARSDGRLEFMGLYLEGFSCVDEGLGLGGHLGKLCVTNPASHIQHWTGFTSRMPAAFFPPCGTRGLQTVTLHIMYIRVFDTLSDVYTRKVV